MKSNIGRRNELAILNRRFNSDNFEFGYIYGKRRIGKTTLMSMFSENKKSLMFYVTDSADSLIRDSFSDTLSEKSQHEYGRFSTWYDFFKAVDEYFGNDKGVMVIDEYPNIILTKDGKKKKTDFQSSLQKAIYLLFKNKKNVLILAGSNVSFIKNEIQNCNTPLYQRNTFSLLVKKFESNKALSCLNNVQNNFTKAKILTLTNTFPYYLSLIDTNLSFDENLIKLFYGKDSIFITNPIQIITSSKKDGGTYSSILSVIAKGKDTLTEICEALKEDSNSIYNFIKELIKDDVLIKRSTFQSKRNIHYEILDPMLAFYYRFIRENTNNIQTGFGLQIKERQNDAIKEFIEHYFEKLCITYLEYLSKDNKLDGLFFNFENYKVENSILNRSIELDIVSQDEDHLLVGEVKFSKNK